VKRYTVDGLLNEEGLSADAAGNSTTRHEPVRKAPYHPPHLKEYGNVATLTGKLGTRADGNLGTGAAKGQGS
jgi:hypothetical protein